MKIYEIKCDFDNFSHFYNNNSYDDRFIRHSRQWEDEVNHNILYKYKMDRSDRGLRNFKLDVSINSNHLILSDRAISFLKETLDKSGTFFEIETDSKRKKFTGFFSNKCIVPDSVINYKTTAWEIFNGERRVCGITYFNKTIENIELDLFVVSGIVYEIYVTEKMKDFIEANNFGGLRFDLAYDSELPMDWKFDIIKSHLDNAEWGEIICKAYNYYGKAEDFDSFVIDKEIIEEQPFIPFYEKDKECIDRYMESLTTGLVLSEYHMSFMNSKAKRNNGEILGNFRNFLSTFEIHLKSIYLPLFPNIRVFDDGTMFGGHFFKGAFPSET